MSKASLPLVRDASRGNIWIFVVAGATILARAVKRLVGALFHGEPKGGPKSTAQLRRDQKRRQKQIRRELRGLAPEGELSTSASRPGKQRVSAR